MTLRYENDTLTGFNGKWIKQIFIHFFLLNGHLWISNSTLRTGDTRMAAKSPGTVRYTFKFVGADMKFQMNIFHKLQSEEQGRENRVQGNEARCAHLHRDH